MNWSYVSCNFTGSIEFPVGFTQSGPKSLDLPPSSHTHPESNHFLAWGVGKVEYIRPVFTVCTRMSSYILHIIIIYYYLSRYIHWTCAKVFGHYSCLVVLGIGWDSDNSQHYSTAVVAKYSGNRLGFKNRLSVHQNQLSIIITGSNSIINLSINWKLHPFVARQTTY